MIDTHRLMLYIAHSSADIIICQSIFRRNVAMQQTQWLLHTRHEEACASFIQEIWRAYVDRERFVRVVSNIDRSKESKSATEIAQAWKAWTAQRSHASAVRGMCVSLLCVSLLRVVIDNDRTKLFFPFRCNFVSNCHSPESRNKRSSRLQSQSVQYCSCHYPIQVEMLGDTSTLQTLYPMYHFTSVCGSKILCM